MGKWFRPLSGLILILTLAACTPEAVPTETVLVPPHALTETLPAPSEPAPTVQPPAADTAAPTPPAATPSVPVMDLPDEAILILEPGPGSRLAGVVRIAGTANTTFEQNLGVRLIAADGTVLTATSTTIAAEMGSRGPFQIELPVTVSEETQGLIQVFSASARDDGITHLAAVSVTFAPIGEVSIVPVEPHPERIVILQPQINASIQGGTVHVEGFGWASFEQTLVVEVIDAEGKVVGTQPIIVDSPEMGQPGPFRVDVPYQVSVPGPGRIVVRDPSPAVEGDLHVASMEVQLQP